MICQNLMVSLQVSCALRENLYSTLCHVYKQCKFFVSLHSLIWIPDLIVFDLCKAISFFNILLLNISSLSFNHYIWKKMRIQHFIGFGSTKIRDYNALPWIDFFNRRKQSRVTKRSGIWFKFDVVWKVNECLQMICYVNKREDLVLTSKRYNQY